MERSIISSAATTTMIFFRFFRPNGQCYTARGGKPRTARLTTPFTTRRKAVRRPSGHMYSAARYTSHYILIIFSGTMSYSVDMGKKRYPTP